MLDYNGYVIQTLQETWRRLWLKFDEFWYLIIINAYLSLSTQEYRGVTINKTIIVSLSNVFRGVLRIIFFIILNYWMRCSIFVDSETICSLQHFSILGYFLSFCGTLVLLVSFSLFIGFLFLAFFIFCFSTVVIADIFFALSSGILYDNLLRYHLFIFPSVAETIPPIRVFVCLLGAVSVARGI